MSPSAQRCLVNRAPRATYRLQLRADFGFEQVRKLLDYLDRLGISDLYLSPLFRAREESSHGYDVVDHARLEPAFGDLASLGAVSAEARRRGMGILLDIVPNHMGINDPNNVAWNDVLENGSVSRYSHYFDIHWQPTADDRQVKVLLPSLGRSFGDVLQSGELRLLYESGRLQIAYHEQRYPLAPATWPPILELMLELLPLAGKVRTELESIITQLEHLPTWEDRSTEARHERYREQAVARRRLAELTEASTGAREALDNAITVYNGTPGDHRSFDRLELLLDAQHYRLAYWRVAVDEINYRRFFDINELVAIRVEDPDVFEAVHKLTFRLLREGLVTGLRVDHPDGLLDPQDYFAQLQSHFSRLHKDRAEGEAGTQLYIVAEKILTGDEQLPTEWPVSGTTGYDFVNLLTRLLVDASGVARLRELYPRMTGINHSPREVLYQSKQGILTDVMSSELSVLAAQLHELARRDRDARDFTQPMLLRALREVIACFPVYRTYIRPSGWEVTTTDHGRVTAAVRYAKRSNPTMPGAAFDYVGSVLLMSFPPHLADELRVGWRRFALRFQQVTGPVAAKGCEDTAFYRYYPLASLNEVGGELDSEAVSLDEFHRLVRQRGETWPLSISATATHDTKRGEDVRARLNVLTEMPDDWEVHVDEWNRDFASLLEVIDEEPVPSRNERYLLYQTLIGTWPCTPRDENWWAQYFKRIAAYMEKSLREAKVRSSWLNPSSHYESAVQNFLSRLLLDARQNGQLSGIDSLVRRIAGAGFVNSLVQLVLKCTLPGVPDFYQGCEFWDFRLVDPDNRCPVDHAIREQELRELQRCFEDDPQALLEDLTAGWHDRVKLYATWRCLSARKRLASMLREADYSPLPVEGPLADHILAFVRESGEHRLAVVVPRHVLCLPTSEASDVVPPRGFCGDLWRGTAVILPDDGREWTCEMHCVTMKVDNGEFDVADLFRNLPAAILSPAAND